MPICLSFFAKQQSRVLSTCLLHSLHPLPPLHLGLPSRSPACTGSLIPPVLDFPVSIWLPHTGFARCPTATPHPNHVRTVCATLFPPHRALCLFFSLYFAEISLLSIILQTFFFFSLLSVKDSFVRSLSLPPPIFRLFATIRERHRSTSFPPQPTTVF